MTTSTVPRECTSTVVMTVRDEPLDRMRRALRSVARQEDCGCIEVVIAAPSEDHAALRLLRPEGAIERITLVENLGGARSAGLNHAVHAATADVIVRVDARSRLPHNYVARCIDRLAEHARVGVVGGRQSPQLQDSSRLARGVARALSNRWLLGVPAYRDPDAGGSVDTVYLGAFRRRELLAVGGYDVGLDANEDFDLCCRYRDAGLDVWLERGLAVSYEPRSSIRAVFGQYRSFGEAKVEFWRRTGRRPNRRQRAAMSAAVASVGIAAVALPRPAHFVRLGLVGLAAIAIVDHVAEPTERDAGVRAWACAASAALTSGWLIGIAQARLRAGRRRVR